MGFPTCTLLWLVFAAHLASAYFSNATISNSTTLASSSTSAFNSSTSTKSTSTSFAGSSSSAGLGSYILAGLGSSAGTSTPSSSSSSTSVSTEDAGSNAPPTHSALPTAYATNSSLAQNSTGARAATSKQPVPSASFYGATSLHGSATSYTRTNASSLDISRSTLGTNSSKTSTAFEYRPTSYGPFSLVSSASSPTGTGAAGQQTNGTYGNDTHTGAAWACQSAQVSWSDAWTRAYSVHFVNSTEVGTYTDLQTVTHGIADVYTTIDGIPRAHGTLTPTSIETWSSVNVSTSFFQDMVTVNATFTNVAPTCTIATSACDSMFSEYKSSVGLPPNATITDAPVPQPSNYPRCITNVPGVITNDPGVNACNAKPGSGGTQCNIQGMNVQLFYWPEGNGSVTAPYQNGSQVVTQVVKNITMTSPSVYLSFPRISAMSTSMNANPCDDGAMGVGNLVQIGSVHSNVLISLAPQSVSSIMQDLGPGVDVSSVVSVIAHGGPEYYSWITSVLFAPSVTAVPVTFTDITAPGAIAYYLNPLSNGYYGTSAGDRGCNTLGPHPECSTIFDGYYRAQLAVPPAIYALDPAWSTCSRPLYGMYDPPIALSGTTLDLPTVTIETSSVSTTPASPSTTPAAPTATATSSPEAQPIVESTTTSTAQATPYSSPGSGEPPSAAPSNNGSPQDSTASSDPTSTAGDPADPAQTTSTSTTQNAGGIIASLLATSSSTTQNAGGVVASLLASSSTEQSTEGQSDPATATSEGSIPQASSEQPAPAPTEATTQTAQEASSYEATSTEADPAGSAAPSSADPGTTNALSILESAVTTAASAYDPSPASSSDDPAVVASTTPAAPVVTVGSSTLTADSASNYQIGSQTLSPGGSEITDSGTTYSLASSGTAIVVNGQSTPVSTPVVAASPTASVPPVITLGSSTLTADSSSNYQVGSQTLAPGGSEVTDSGTTYSLATSGTAIVVNGQTTPVTTDSPAVSTPAAAPITIGSSTLTADSSSNYQIGSQTLAPGGSAVTESGTTYSLASSATAIVINGATTPVSSPSSSAFVYAPAITLGSSVVTANSASQYVVGSQTLAPGSAITADDTTYSLATSGTAVVVNGETSLIAPLVPSPTPVITIGSSLVTADSASQYIVGSATLSAGGSAITSDGTTYSLVASGSALVVNGQTTAISEVTPNLGVATAFPLVSATGSPGAESVTTEVIVGSGASASTYAAVMHGDVISVASTTIAANGAAITLDGEVIAMKSSYLVVGSSTALLPTLVNAPDAGQTPATAIITVGNQVYTATEQPGSNEIEIGSTTLRIGGGVATLDGQTVSAYAGGLAVGTSSVPIAAAESASAIPSGAIVTIGGEAFTVVEPAGTSNEFVVGSQTISLGGAAAVVQGQTISAITSGIVIGSSTISIVPGPSDSTTTEIAAVITVGSSVYTVAPSAQLGPSPVLVVGSETLTIGGPAVTTAGEVLSAASDGVEVNGSLVGLSLVTISPAISATTTSGSLTQLSSTATSTASSDTSITPGATLGSAGPASVAPTGAAESATSGVSRSLPPTTAALAALIAFMSLYLQIGP